MPPDQAYKHGTFFDGIRDAAFVPAEIWGVACQVYHDRDFKRTCILNFIYLLILVLADPIGVATNSARSSEELFYRIVSPDYPSASLDPNSDNPFDDNTRIVVVVINDVTLRHLGETWPPAFSIHKEVLEKILGASAPKAVFVDFGFFDARDPDEVADLASMFHKYSLPAREFPHASELWPHASSASDPQSPRGATPVFLAGAPKGLTIIKALERAVTGTVSTRYAAAHEQEHDGYLLYDFCMGMPSAALALYAVERDDWRSWNLNGCPVKRSWQGRSNELSIYWATWGGTKNGRGIYGCRDMQNSKRARVGQILNIWLAGLLGGDDLWSDQFQTCPPHLAISAQDILNDDGTFAALMAERYVFYGGNFAMADDLVVPPTHEPVPGVFLHAMALDNLRRLDPYIGRGTGHRLTDGSWWLTLAIAALMSVLIALARTGYHELAKRPDSSKATCVEACGGHPACDFLFNRLPYPSENQIIGSFWWFVCFWLSVTAVFLAVGFGFYVLHWAPANFVGLLSFLGLHTAITGFRQLLLSIY